MYIHTQKFRQTDRQTWQTKSRFVKLCERAYKLTAPDSRVLGLSLWLASCIKYYHTDRNMDTELHVVYKPHGQDGKGIQMFFARYGQKSPLGRPRRKRRGFRFSFSRVQLSKGEASSSTAWPLKMEPTGCPKTSVLNHLTPRNNPEDERIQSNSGRSLRSRTGFRGQWRGHRRPRRGRAQEAAKWPSELTFLFKTFSTLKKL